MIWRCLAVVLQWKLKKSWRKFVESFFYCFIVFKRPSKIDFKIHFINKLALLSTVISAEEQQKESFTTLCLIKSTPIYNPTHSSSSRKLFNLTISIVFSKNLINEEHLFSLIILHLKYTMIIFLLHHQAESENDTLVTQYSFIKQAWRKQSVRLCAREREREWERQRDR